jgi:hypothetical protein
MTLINWKNKTPTLMQRKRGLTFSHDSHVNQRDSIKVHLFFSIYSSQFHSLDANKPPKGKQMNREVKIKF